MDFFKRIPTHMDFEGQRKAERIFQVIIVAHAIIGFAIGYAVQQFSYTVYTIIFGFLLSCAIVLPPWPYFRKDPLNWQKFISGDSAQAPHLGVGGTGKSGGTQPSKKKK